MHLPKVVNLNALPDNLESLTWEAYSSHGREGARIHDLHRDADTGQRAALVHLQPGAQAQAHRHEDYESIYVLEGGFQDETGRYAKGDLVVYPAGSHHAWRSAEGGVMYIVWGGPVSAYSG
ncbi:cupin domain-containing protein [Jeongeupia wiesaeckerbachi]|uniref:cupin domain-containing protein n=1 Tax=Jeongeupia wiesaeckerbachi TaxID=3051218 RepID=UPI003D803242